MFAKARLIIEEEKEKRGVRGGLQNNHFRRFLLHARDCVILCVLLVTLTYVHRCSLDKCASENKGDLRVKDS